MTSRQPNYPFQHLNFDNTKYYNKIFKNFKLELKNEWGVSLTPHIGIVIPIFVPNFNERIKTYTKFLHYLPFKKAQSISQTY